MSPTNAVPTIDELIELPEPGDPQISPDGTRVAYVELRPDWQKNEFVSQLWLVDTITEAAPRQFTFAAESSTRPRWAPDSQCRSLMQDNFDWFNRWIWGEDTAEGAERRCYVALATTAQADEATPLPASSRYTAAAVGDVGHWARRDSVDFRILSAQHGLLAPETAVLPDDQPVVNADLAASLAALLATQLTEEGWREIILYTRPPADQPIALIPLGCLQIAAGIAGQVAIKHEAVDEDRWRV